MPARAELKGRAKTAMCSTPGCVMFTSPAGDRPAVSERSKQPSLQRMSRHNLDAGGIACFGRRTPGAHPASMPSPSSPEIDISGAHGRDRGKVHGS
jgi:hypothetical protein